MNEQVRLRKMVDGKGRRDQVAVWNDSGTIGGSEDLILDDKGRLRNLNKPVVTEAPQDGKLYGRRDAGWSEVVAGTAIVGGGGGEGGGDGTQGPPGPQGPAGPIGPQGEQGEPGPAGADGADGATGATGPQGPTGATGPQGEPGPAGADGATGPAGDPQYVTVSDTSPIGAADGALWWDSDSGLLYVLYNDGDSTQWVIASPSGATGLQGEQGPQGAQGLPGADADARHNRIVNGAMQISQENGNTSATTHGYYAADQWGAIRVTSAGVVSFGRVETVTSNGSRYRLAASCSTIDASIAAGEYWIIYTVLEGNRIADFMWGTASARQVILRFGFKGPAGTFAVSITNSANTRSYIAMFTISAGQANTDTTQTFVIPGDVTGVWVKDTGIGLYLQFSLALGSTFHGVAGWQAGAKYGTSATTNGMASISNAFSIFDVGLYLDPDSTGVAPRWEMPDPAAELVLCQRYYEKTDPTDANLGIFAQAWTGIDGSVAPTFPWNFKATKRVTPTAGTFGTFTQVGHSGGVICGNMSATNAVFSQGNALADTRSYFYNNANSGLWVNARL